MRFLVLAFLLFFIPLSAKKSSTLRPAIPIDKSSEIVFGMSGSLTGHFGFYGISIVHAIQACFNKVNDTGGIGGKKLRLLCMDDQGRAEQTSANIQEMREQNIDMFLGVMGTRGILSTLPMVKAKQIALLFPWGGDNALHDATLTNLVNGPGYLQPQLELLVDHIVNKIHLKNISIIHADDDFSTNAGRYLVSLLKKHQLNPLNVQYYNRFTMDIQTPAHRLIQQDPRVVICISTSIPTLKLINYFFRSGHFGTQFFGIDSTFLVQKIAKKSRGINFQYASPVPNPSTSTIPLAQHYRNDLKKYFPDDPVSILSFTYYTAASIIVQALSSLPSITANALVEQIGTMTKTDLQGFAVTFDPSNRQAFGQKTWLI